MDGNMTGNMFVGYSHRKGDVSIFLTEKIRILSVFPGNEFSTLGGTVISPEYYAAHNEWTWVNE